jgi:hypothetical protein
MSLPDRAGAEPYFHDSQWSAIECNVVSASKRLRPAMRNIADTYKLTANVQTAAFAARPTNRVPRSSSEREFLTTDRREPKTVGPFARRQAVTELVQTHQLPIRRACQIRSCATATKNGVNDRASIQLLYIQPGKPNQTSFSITSVVVIGRKCLTSVI